MKQSYENMQNNSLQFIKTLRSQCIKYKKKQNLRITVQNELITFISKSTKFNLNWQKIFFKICLQIFRLLDQLHTQTFNQNEQQKQLLILDILKYFDARYKQKNDCLKLSIINQLIADFQVQNINIIIYNLINLLVDQTRIQFNKILPEILHKIFRNLRLVTDKSYLYKRSIDKTATVYKQITEIEQQPNPLSKQINIKSYFSDNLDNGFKNIYKQLLFKFANKFKIYYHNLIFCLPDLDLKYIQEKDTKKFNLETWLATKMKSIVEFNIKNNNFYIKKTIDNYQNQVKLKLKKRQNLFHYNETKPKECKTKIKLNVKKSFTFYRTHQKLPKSINIQSKEQQFLHDQNSISLNLRRQQYQIKKLPIELEVSEFNKKQKQLKPNSICNKNKRPFQFQLDLINYSELKTLKQDEKFAKNNRITGLLKRTMVHSPTYIQILKQIINF